MKNRRKTNTLATIQNIKIVQRGKIDIPNTLINDIPLSWLETDTSIKRGEVKLHKH